MKFLILFLTLLTTVSTYADTRCEIDQWYWWKSESGKIRVEGKLKRSGFDLLHFTLLENGEYVGSWGAVVHGRAFQGVATPVRKYKEITHIEYTCD